MTDHRDERTTPHGMWRYGQDFYSAACVVREHHKAESFMPFHFLIYQSIELSLKAYLLKKGITVAELKGKKYGHDVKKILDASLENGLKDHVALDQTHIAVIKIANEEYRNKRFQYIQTGSMTVPDVELIINAARLLTVGLEAVCCIPRHSTK